jgi:hypothetical protein
MEELRDAISPYGYPGGSEASPSPPDPAAIDWSESGLVSVFIRDRIGDDACLAGGTVRSRVHIADGEGGIASDCASRSAETSGGWAIRPPGRGDPASAPRSGALMVRPWSRTGAPSGTCTRARLSGCSRAAKLAGPRQPGRRRPTVPRRCDRGRSDGYLHYYLGGTADEALADSPMKNLFAGMITLGDELGLPVNLGGGVSPGDSLDEFKRGFANADAPFRTHELVCDPAAYEKLPAGRGSSKGSFPLPSLSSAYLIWAARPLRFVQPLRLFFVPFRQRPLCFA